jgi:predicted DNA binding CopG/RHH family protein
MKRKVPELRTDEAAEAFLMQDLSDLDFSQFKPLPFEYAAKDERITMRLPSDLLISIKAKAAEKHIPYQRYIRQLIEQGLR